MAKEFLLPDDVIYEILSFRDDFNFVIMNCSLISKQWENVIRSLCHHLSCKCNFENINGEFLQCISSFKILKTTHTCDLQLICKLTQLTDLDISNIRSCDNYRVKLIEGLERLKILNINNTICDEGAKYISELKKLKSLSIVSNNITEIGCKYIRQMNQLTHLDMAENCIGDEGLECISELHLIYLDVYNNNIGDEGIQHITKLKELKSFGIGLNNIGAESCKYIGELKELTKLDINYNDVGDEGIKYLSELTKLTSLDISNNDINVDDEGTTHLGQLKHATVTISLP